MTKLPFQKLKKRYILGLNRIEYKSGEIKVSDIYILGFNSRKSQRIMRINLSKSAPVRVWRTHRSRCPWSVYFQSTRGIALLDGKQRISGQKSDEIWFCFCADAQMPFCFVTPSGAISWKDKGQQEWSPNGAGDRSHRPAACLSQAAWRLFDTSGGGSGGTLQKEDSSKTHKEEPFLQWCTTNNVVTLCK